MEKFSVNQGKLVNKLESKKAQPIITCILDRDAIDQKTYKILTSLKENSVDIDYYANEDLYQKNNMKNAGSQTYVISKVDGKNKISSNYYDCTGVVVAGKSRNGKEISFMSHQDPLKFLRSKKEFFVRDISERIKEFLEKAQAESIDAVIFGGNAGDSDYKESIKLLGRIIKDQIGFEPTVMTGPNKAHGETDVLFDTTNRRLYIARRDQYANNRLNEHYLPSELDAKSKEW